MRSAGIDIGSRTIKAVVVENYEVVYSIVTDTTYNPMQICREIVSDLEYDQIVTTGYGRHLFKQNWDDVKAISEIKAAAIGARELFPECRTILDIGGQDNKAIALDENGKIRKFSMNDKCAAGTGRFLEVMATALSFTREQFIKSAAEAKESHKLSSMCTVFAESEVISLVARGVDRAEIALGIHQSIATRASSLLKSIPIQNDILFAGGGALNSCLASLIEKLTKSKLHIPLNPQIVTALGCALHTSGANHH